jgi:FkbM family methyltransferase
MTANPRKVAFVLAATDQGTFLVNRFDHHTNNEKTYGVGEVLLQFGSRDQREIDIIAALLNLRREHFGSGVVAIDCGANIGIHTVSLARQMTGWGDVVAFEAQERLFYALCGNVTINNVFNARAFHVAVAGEVGRMRIPVLDHASPASFGSLELKPASKEAIGQSVDYSEKAGMEVHTITLDSLGLARVDFIKIDVEGMEMEVLKGARNILTHLKPIVFLEWAKSNAAALREYLNRFGYVIFDAGINLFAVHQSDKSIAYLTERVAKRSATEP